MEPTLDPLTPAWLTELRRLFAEAAPATRDALGDRPFILQEAFFDMPDGKDLVYHLVFQNGEVSDYRFYAAAKPDYGSRSPFHRAALMAATVIGADPESQAAYQALKDGYVEYEMNCDLETMAGFAKAIGDVHNLIAAQTRRTELAW